MNELDQLFERNRAWSRQVREQDPEFFSKLSAQQRPAYLWIGCADSRVPANQITGLAPGEVFVHRNVANVVVHTDLNCLSVIQFAVDVLRVKHIMVVGHYGCSGVASALAGHKVGLADNWLRHVQDVATMHREMLDALADGEQRLARLCELNVLEQASNVCRSTIVRDAWERGQSLAIHAWVYGLADGLLHDLRFNVSRAAELQSSYDAVLEQLGSGGDAVQV